ncbi:hypothetical protein [Actinoplanes sp. NPDC051851]|uniref:hypothetical protein n=1 Tax=Actinoplanes sp. NPDC051851 TaxID=3154753 RepID=UPI003415F054
MGSTRIRDWLVFDLATLLILLPAAAFGTHLYLYEPTLPWSQDAMVAGPGADHALVPGWLNFTPLVAGSGLVVAMALMWWNSRRGEPAGRSAGRTRIPPRHGPDERDRRRMARRRSALEQRLRDIRGDSRRDG